MYYKKEDSVYYLCYSDLENLSEVELWETKDIEKVTDVYDPYAFCLNYLI